MNVFLILNQCVVMEDSMEDKDLDYQPPVDFLINEEKSKRQITTLNCFLAACGSKRKVNVTTCYKDLSHRVKLRYVSLVTFSMRAATSLVASNDAPMFMHDSLRNMNSEDSNIALDGNFRQIMSGCFRSIH